jgi:hypothetical protein
VSAPFIGVLADRCSRAGVTLGVSLVSMTGYLLLGLLSDPLSWSLQLGGAVVCLGKQKKKKTKKKKKSSKRMFVSSKVSEKWECSSCRNLFSVFTRLSPLAAASLASGQCAALLESCSDPVSEEFCMLLLMVLFSFSKLVFFQRYKYMKGAPFLIFAAFSVIVSIMALVLYVREKLAARRLGIEKSLEAPVAETLKENQPLIVQ